jgi:hypothetical protein
MAKKKDKEAEMREQLDLIDVAPESAKKIVGVARRYKAAQVQRIEILEQEVNEKQKLLALVKEAKLTPVDGKIKFRCDGLIITVTPRDELVKVKDESERE